MTNTFQKITAVFLAAVMVTALLSPVTAAASSGSPASLKTKVLSDNRVSLSWSRTKNTKGYEVFRAAKKNGKYRRIKTTTSRTFRDTKRKAGKSFFYKVRAFRTVKNKRVYGSFSTVKKAVVPKKGTIRNDKTGIPDKGLYKAVLDELKNEKIISKNRTTFTKKEAAKLKWMRASGRKIKSLKGIENLTKLESLAIEYNKILTSLSGIEKLTRLKFLNISNTRVTSLVPLKKLTKLESLHANRNLLSSLAPLKNLTKLKRLSAYSNKITSLVPLKKLTRLEELSVGGNRITSLAGIGNLKKLKDLEVYDNRLTSLVPLKNLTKLEELSVGGNRIISLAGIEELTNLKNLSVGGNRIISLAGIEELTNLKKLSVGWNRIISLEGIENLTNLNELSAPFNKIVNADSLSGLKKLLWLDLAANKLSRLPDLRYLTTSNGGFHFDGNQLTREELIAKMPVHFTNHKGWGWLDEQLLPVDMDRYYFVENEW